MEQGLLTTLGRRVAQRICLRTDVGLLDPATGERALGQLRDLSASGACLTTSAPLPIGKELRLAFEFEAGQEPVRLHAEVAWSGRSDGSDGAVLSGVRFRDLSGADLGRLRAFLDGKLWQMHRFLSSVALFSDLNDLEKMLLASIAFDRDLRAGERLEGAVLSDALVIVRAGLIDADERLADGRSGGRTQLRSGDVCGALPIDARGSSRVSIIAATDAAIIVLPADGFSYLWGRHPETTLKLLACWCLALRDRLFAVEPSS